MGKEYYNGLPGGKHIDLRLRYRIEATVHGTPGFQLEYGDLHINREKLPYKPRVQKGKPKAPPRRAWKNPGNISIEEHPESVATREEFGHWEMDTIVSCVGGRGGVLILVERQTRFAVTAKLNRLTKHDVLHALKKVRGEMKAIRSITTDWLNSLHRQKLNDISPKQAFFLAA